MDPAGSGGRVGDDSLRDARFEAFLEVASPPDLPPDIAAQIRLGLARQYDAPPVEQTALVLRSNCNLRTHCNVSSPCPGTRRGFTGPLHSGSCCLSFAPSKA